jgi:phage terminase large subunit-like protein
VKVRNLIMGTSHEDLNPENWRGMVTRGTYKIRMEQEPGATGKIVIDDYAAEFVGINFEGDRPTGAKETRAQPLAQKAEQGRVKIREAPFNEALLGEI